jgi:hypothetical protein
MTTIDFSDDAAKFLLLNIIAHDPIHDYNDYNSERWLKNQKYLEQMGQIIGGMPTRSTTRTTTRRTTKETIEKCDNNTIFNRLGPNNKQYANFTGRKKCHPSSIVTTDARKKRRSIVNAKRFIMNMDKTLFLEEYFDHIKNQVILNAIEFIFFNKMINSNTPFTIPVSDIFLICYDDTYVDANNEESFEKSTDVLDSPFENKNSVNKSVKKIQAKIIEIISTDFYFFARYCLEIENFKDMYHLIECLNNYLLTERIKTIVNEHIETGDIRFDDEEDAMSQDYYAEDEMNNIDSYSDDDDDHSMNGGAKKILPTDNQKFINEINEYWETVQTDSDFTSIFNNDDLIIGYAGYNNKRSQIINTVIEICKNNGIQSKELKYLQSNMERLYPSQLKRKPRQPSNLQDRIKEAILFSIIDAKKIIEEDAEKAAKKAEKDAAAADAGNLTSDEKKRVDNFMKFIARFGLWSMGICTLVGSDDARQVQSGTDPLLLKEIDCLKAIAEWPSMQPQLKNTDLDKRIITNFFNFYTENGGLIPEESASCNTTKKYIINNAGSIDNLQNKVFCPTSSIVDAMTTTCTWNMAQNSGIEEGNVDYTIKSNSNSFSYQGKTTFIQDPIKTSGAIIPATTVTEFIESKLIAALPNGIVIEGTKIINVPKSIELKAHVALKNTMIVVIEQMYNLIDTTKGGTTDYFSSGKIWSKLFYYGVNEQSYQFFKNLFAELLFKGRGDLDQEINAAIKKGAYTTPLNYTKANIEQFKVEKDGDAMRYFVANDRPSACRFMYILKNAPADKVNKRAFGGYFSNIKRVLVNSNIKRVLVKRDEMPGPCLAAGGGRNISKTNKVTLHNKTKKKKQSKRLTMRFVIKTNKKTRKNKYHPIST